MTKRSGSYYIYRLFTLGRGALAGQAVLPRPVGAAEQDTGLVVLVVSVAASGPFDGSSQSTV